MSKKIGEGHAAAMGRQGLRELRAAFYPESNVAQPAEYGLYGTRTPGEVAEARRDDGREEEPQAQGGEQRDLEEEKKPSALAERLERADSREDPGRDARAPERE